ncbi:unnamed protein product [marine sediment metagenome]|uniref:Uncharacterized protein n=1 Tax=marine sediment metagenome TaxID=412755 RepID=X1CHA7_9ZZZZ
MKLQILLEKPTDKILLITFLLTFILTFVFVAFIFAPLLAQFPTGAGLMDMKAAWNKKNMDKIIAIKIPSITSNNTLTQDTIDKLR